MAEPVGQRGNVFYKEGKYELALTLYLKALQLDPEEPKYPSNASAVCYELGRYASAIAQIQAAWKCYFERNPVLPSDDAFATKLATRFAKSKLNGISNRSINLHEQPSDETRQFEGAIEKFAMDHSTDDAQDPKVKEMKASWEQFLAVRGLCTGHSKDECTAHLRVAAAEKRLRALPIYKSSAEPTLEYYTFSHDEAKSLLNGLDGGKTGPYVLDTKAAKATKDWSFLFGGSGDGRHAFTTLQHLSFMKKKRNTGDLNVHITLVDIHPAPLARTLVVLSLLEKVMAARAKDDTEQHTLLQTTLFYVYNWLVIPAYCRDIFLQACQNLIQDLDDESSAISQLVHIDRQSLDAIMVVLRYWSKPLDDKLVSPMMKDIYASRIFEKIDGLPPFPMPGMNIPRDPKRTRPRKPNAYDDYEGEKDVFKRVPVLLPPRALASRHPALAELTTTYTSSSVEAAAKKAKQEVLKTWQLNPTIFDNSSTEHPNLSKDGYPLDIPNPYDNIDGFAKAVNAFQFTKPPSFCTGDSSFEISAQYFEMVADAIQSLRKGLKVEIIVGDVMSGIPRLLEGDTAPRPDIFPKKFTRMWLSNVPDYTQGFLSTAMYLLPYLQPGQLAVSNLLLNSMCWRSMADFCFNYVLIYPQDFPRFLGCEVVHTEAQTWGEMALKPLPLPREQTDLGSKKELHDWLTRLLLCILRNGGYRQPPSRVSMPANLGMFFHVLAHLYRVGYPSHWIGDFLQAIISDSLLTDARPYLGQLPITQDYARQKNPIMKAHLSPWRANLEVIIASTQPALRFALALPENFPVLADICVYSARVTSDRGMSWTRQFSFFAQTLGIIFFKPRSGINGYTLASAIERIIDGSSNAKDTDVQVMLSLERVNIARGEVSWRMSQQWYEKMRNEGWTMVVYRDDSQAPVTEPLPAANWHKLLSFD